MPLLGGFELVAADVEARRFAIAQRMRARREELRFSRPVLYRALGVSKYTYKRWEDGERSIPAEIIPDLAAALYMTVEALVSSESRVHLAPRPLEVAA